MSLRPSWRTLGAVWCATTACTEGTMILVDTHPVYRQITLNRPDRLNALQPEMADAIIAALDDAQADEVLSRGAADRRRARLLRRAGPDRDRRGRPGRHRRSARGLSSGDRKNPRIAAAGRRRGQRRRGRRRVQSGARLRHRHRGALGEFRAGLRPHRARARLRRHLVSAAPRRHGARPRADDARRAAAGRHRRRMGHDLAGRR